jgi:hypothetical protein
LGRVSLSFSRAFRVEPYGWHVYLFTHREKWARFCARRLAIPLGEIRDEAAQAHGYTRWNDDEAHCYVGVFDGEVSTLAHEMTHAAVAILAGAGVRYTPTNHESLAYLVGHLVEQCDRAVRRKRHART